MNYLPHIADEFWQIYTIENTQKQHLQNILKMILVLISTYLNCDLKSNVTLLRQSETVLVMGTRSMLHKMAISIFYLLLKATTSRQNFMSYGHYLSKILSINKIFERLKMKCALNVQIRLITILLFKLLF